MPRRGMGVEMDVWLGILVDKSMSCPAGAWE